MCQYLCIKGYPTDVFVLFVNDMPDTVRQSTLDLYADDITLKAASKDLPSVRARSLNEDLNWLSQWMSANRLILNLKKTLCMVVGTAMRLSTLQTEELNITVDGTRIQQVETCKLLGVTVDRTLSWGDQINNVCRNLSSKLGLIKHLRPVLPANALKSLYSAIVVPVFDYCDVVWGNADDGLMDKIQRMQHRGARILTSSRAFCRVTPLYQQLGWARIRDRVKYHKATLVYKSLHGLAPSYLSRGFTEVQHGYQTRHTASAHTLRAPFPKLATFKRSFVYSGAQLWNSLPPRVRGAESLGTFKRLYMDRQNI